LTVGVVLATVE